MSSGSGRSSPPTRPSSAGDRATASLPRARSRQDTSANEFLLVPDLSADLPADAPVRPRDEHDLFARARRERVRDIDVAVACPVEQCKRSRPQIADIVVLQEVPLRVPPPSTHYLSSPSMVRR